MGAKLKAVRTELILLGLTAVFLGGLLTVSYRDRTTATVTVTENAETHALEAQVAYSKGGKAADAVAFSNSYAPAATWPRVSSPSI